jgi:phosphatidate cytidylyltransferase
MLRWRLIFGALFISALVLFCWLDAVVITSRPGVFLLPVALMVSWAAVVEMLDIFNARGRKPQAWVLFCGVLGTVLLAGLPVLWPGAASENPFVGPGRVAGGLAIGLILALVGELHRFDGRWHTTINLGLAAFTILYLGGLMGFIVLVRAVGWTGSSPNGQMGMLALVSLIATVKMSDSGQYLVGRLIGRHKLSPVVSPGKTWEGAVGGVVFAVGTAWLVFTTVAREMVEPAPRVGPIEIVFFGILVAVAGIVGDLAESMLKRDASVKDSSTWLPGFGGVLDMIDSLLLAAPVAYLFWVAVILRK